MRLRLAFKLHGEEAELARQIADAAGIEADKIAKLAMQRYMRDVLERAEEMAKQVRNNQDEQSSNSDPIHSLGAVPESSDPIPG